MNCQRCNGLMYQMELRDSKGFERLTASVCVICGEITDSLIRKNRSRGVNADVLLPKRIPRHSKYWRKLKHPVGHRKITHLADNV